MFDASESFFSLQTLLWLAGSAVAAVFLFGSINRRKTRLTDSLRDYVDRQQADRESARPNPEEDTPAD